MEAPNTEPKDLRSLGLETWVPMTVHREALKNAPYNPRILSEAEKRKLKEGLKRHGHVTGITWNERTGNIVGGHQRISLTDSLAGTKNYTLTVARIDVDEGREKELNILLNNPNAQGEWDLEKLSELVKDPLVDLAGMGFDHADLYRLFGDSPIEARNENLDALAQKVREARDRYNAIEKKNGERNDAEFYCVVVFRSSEQLGKFLTAAGLPDNRYQSGEEFARLAGLLEKLTQ